MLTRAELHDLFLKPATAYRGKGGSAAVIFGLLCSFKRFSQTKQTLSTYHDCICLSAYVSKIHATRHLLIEAGMSTCDFDVR